jgi:hypothetical protein
MSLHTANTVSRAPGNRDAPPYAAISRSLGRLAHEWHDEPLDYDRGHLLHDRTKPGALNAAVEFTPSEVVKRRALTWPGMAAETAHLTENCRIESRFRLPFTCSCCSRRVRARMGPPSSRACRDLRFETTGGNSSSCRPVMNTTIAKSPPVSPERHISISIQRRCRSGPTVDVLRCLSSRDCSSKMQDYGTRPSS